MWPAGGKIDHMKPPKKKHETARKPRFRKNAHKRTKRTNPLFGKPFATLREDGMYTTDDPSFVAMAAQIAGDVAIAHAVRGMRGEARMVLAGLIEIVIRPMLNKVSKKDLETAILRIESDRIEGEYEECR